MSIDLPLYGSENSTYQTVGSLEGITQLVDRFYDLMASLPEAKELLDMHPQDLTSSRQKLVYFLSGWMGGPKLYAEHYGTVSLPVAHRHLPIDHASKGMWLHCMATALEQLNYPQALRDHLMAKFETPAESIRLMAEFEQNKQP